MDIKDALATLDMVISKSRVHLYKPIQIAEILYRHRIIKDFRISNLEDYRVNSRKWRDKICQEFLGRVSTSSSRYQDDIFNENAIPPKVLEALAKENCEKNGIIEAHIYAKFYDRFSQMSSGLDYCNSHNQIDFQLQEFFDLFWNDPGLKRSIDKIYEIVVYSLFSAIVDALGVTIEVKLDPTKIDILNEFNDFALKILALSNINLSMQFPARLNRVGVTNAADRGLDMWANFGLAIQIKHLALTEDRAEDIVSSISSDRIVIVCKDSEKKLILSLLNQIGWKAKIQSIVTETDLLEWYEKALRGQNASLIAMKVLTNLREEIKVEFPATDNDKFKAFIQNRGYEEFFKKFKSQTGS
jgi:hypothetical protein